MTHGMNTVSEPAPTELLVRITEMDRRISDQIAQLRTLLSEHADEMRSDMQAFASQTNTQETRLTLVEQQVEVLRSDNTSMKSTVDANKLLLAKATAIAALTAFLIPVVVDLGVTWIEDHPRQSEAASPLLPGVPLVSRQRHG